jgi:VanZ family protein
MISKSTSRAKLTKTLGAICLCISCGILFAGLWPFHAPNNEVSWSSDKNGLLFGKHGTALSSGTVEMKSSQEEPPCSLEIWLEPCRTADSSTLLTFYAPENLRQFSLHQSISDLALRSDIRDEGHRTRTDRCYVDGVFHRGRQMFITVTSGGGQTLVYIDGALSSRAVHFPLSAKDFTGKLVVANSPLRHDSWAGFLRGLALYNQELTPARVFHHYQTWTTRGRPDITENERAVALYLFDEGTGSVIRNRVPEGMDLLIPERYLVVRQTLLEPFWKEFSPSWDYLKEVLINITGFIPLGLFFCAYLSSAGHIKRPGLVTIILGFAVSLTIEVLQAYLPTRDSGTTVLITSTFGTGLGVWLYRCHASRVLFAIIEAHLVRVSGKGRIISYLN